MSKINVNKLVVDKQRIKKDNKIIITITFFSDDIMVKAQKKCTFNFNSSASMQIASEAKAVIDLFKSLGFTDAAIKEIL